MVEKTLFAGPGFALSLAHLMRGGGAEAQTFFPRRCLLGDPPGEGSSAGAAQQGWTSPASPGDAASPLWQPRCLSVY